MLQALPHLEEGSLWGPKSNQVCSKATGRKKCLEQHLNAPQHKPSAQPKCICLWAHLEDITMEWTPGTSSTGNSRVESLASLTSCTVMLCRLLGTWIFCGSNLSMLASLAPWRSAERKTGTRGSVLARYPSVGRRVKPYSTVRSCVGPESETLTLLRRKRNISLCFQFSPVR